MKQNALKTSTDHEAALLEIQRLWNAKPGTAESRRLENLVTLVEAYEEAKFPMSSPLTNLKLRDPNLPPS